MEFLSGCKNLEDKARLGYLDSKAVFQAIEANLENISWTQHFTVWCGSSPSWLQKKTLMAAEFCFMLPNYCKIFDSP